MYLILCCALFTLSNVQVKFLIAAPMVSVNTRENSSPKLTNQDVGQYSGSDSCRWLTGVAVAFQGPGTLHPTMQSPKICVISRINKYSKQIMALYDIVVANTRKSASVKLTLLVSGLTMSTIP